MEDYNFFSISYFLIVKNSPIKKNNKLKICPIVKLKNKYPNCSSGTLKNSNINLNNE